MEKLEWHAATFIILETVTSCLKIKRFHAPLSDELHGKMILKLLGRWANQEESSIQTKKEYKINEL